MFAPIERILMSLYTSITRWISNAQMFGSILWTGINLDKQTTPKYSSIEFNQPIYFVKKLEHHLFICLV